MYLSPRGGFGLFLKRPGTFQDWHDPLKSEDVAENIKQLCEQLTIPGLVHRVMEPREEITADYEAGSVIDVTQHDGSVVRLRKLTADHDPQALMEALFISSPGEQVPENVARIDLLGRSPP